MHFHFCEALIRLFSQARQRKDTTTSSPLISAGDRLNSENSPVLLKYATVLGQISLRCRESTERCNQPISALISCPRARPSRAYTQTFPANNCETANWSGSPLSTGTVAADWFPRIPRFRPGVRKLAIDAFEVTSFRVASLHYITDTDSM